MYTSAYPVFIMYEQLNLNGFFKTELEYGLDEIWDSSCEHYQKFVESKYNDEYKSEYDCIVDYVNALYDNQ